MRQFLSIIIVFIVVTVSACGIDPVAEDLKSYTAEILKLGALETEAIKAYESVTGANAKDNEQAFAMMNGTVIPKYRELIGKLEAIRPKTKEVREVHDIYVKAANKQFSAFSQMTSNAVLANMVQVNQTLSDARAEMRTYLDNLNELKKKHGIQ